MRVLLLLTLGCCAVAHCIEQNSHEEHHWDVAPRLWWPQYRPDNSWRTWRDMSWPKRNSNQHHRNSTGRRSHKKWSSREEWPIYVPVPVPVPVSAPAAPPLPSPPPPTRVPMLIPPNLAAFGLGGLQGASTASSSSLQGGPISATVTLTGPGGVPLRASTSSSAGLLSLPGLAAQLQSALPAGANSPAAQAAAQVVAAAQAAYNAQAAYQAQAAEATRAATQAAYAQQAAAVARNAANTLSGGLGQALPPLPPF